MDPRPPHPPSSLDRRHTGGNLLTGEGGGGVGEGMGLGVLRQKGLPVSLSFRPATQRKTEKERGGGRGAESYDHKKA